MSTRFRRLLGVCLWHLGGRSERSDEQMASLRLYGTSARQVKGTVQKRPASAENAAGLTRGDGSDGEHRTD